MSKETFGEQIGRLESMANPSGTWDLSDNDMAAIGAVLASHGQLLKALVRAEHKLSAYVGVCKGDKELTDTILPMSRAAIAGCN